MQDNSGESRDAGDLSELAYELTGDVGQAPARLMGRVCRERFTGVEPWRAEVYIDMEERTAKRALGVMAELGWKMEKPANLRAFLESTDGKEIIELAEKHYQAYYGSSADKNGQHFGGDSQKCPYQESRGESKACFSCPARKQMIDEFQERAENERGRE